MTYVRTEEDLEPDVPGRVRDGIGIVCQTPDDLLDLIARLVRFREQMADLRLQASADDTAQLVLLGQQVTRGTFLSGTIDLSADLADAELHTVSENEGLAELITGLAQFLTIWRGQPDADVARFRVAVGVTRGERGGTVVLETETAGFTSFHGSLRQAWGKVVRAIGWAASLLIPHPPTVLAHELVRDIRARQAAQTQRSIPNIRDWTYDMQHSRAMVILVHGLMSTDVKTFDGLLDTLALPSDIVCVGFPHNTLAPIFDNAIELATCLDARLATHADGRITVDERPILFACHSRGGLVARAACVLLARDHPEWWKTLVGCVTFGTPHEGTPLAEISGDVVQKLLAIDAANRTRMLHTAAEMHSYLNSGGTLAGIRDLRPMGSADATFLPDLLERELRYGRVPLFAVGGHSTNMPILTRAVSAALQTSDHDLVVPLNSSIPHLLAVNGTDVRCDHLSYFNRPGEPHLQDATYFVRKKLNY